MSGGGGQALVGKWDECWMEQGLTKFSPTGRIPVPPLRKKPGFEVILQDVSVAETIV